MSQLFTGNALWHLITQSDAISKGVLLILLVLSIISWTLFIYKLLILRRKRKELAYAKNQLEKVTNLEELLMLAQRLDDTAGGYFINKNMHCLRSFLETAKSNGRVGLHSEERELLREHSYQVADQMLAQEEKVLPFFSATVAVSPLLGLFGTVWGLVHAFISISQKQSADIATVAPGIAEALITTLAGLMVAIPALIMFVYLNTLVKNIEQLFISITDRFVFIAHRLIHK